MTTTEAALCLQHGQPVIVEPVIMRAPGPGEVLVEMAAAAVCMTDVMSVGGLTPSPPPYIPGHSGAGTVLQLGSDVTGLRVGDTVAATGSAECGRCYACLRGTPSACEDIRAGMFPPLQVATRLSGEAVVADLGCGVFARQMVLRESVLARYEADITAVQAATLGCGIVSGLGAVFNVARVEPGATVAILGAGHLGLWITQAAHLAQAEQIIVIEPDDRRRSVAAVLGATHLVDPRRVDPEAHVKELTHGRGIDYVFECAGTVAGTMQGYRMTREAGVLVTTSMAQLDEQVTFNAFDIGVSARQIRSSQSGGSHIKRDVHRFAGLLERGSITTDPIIDATFPLEDLDQAFAAARNREVITGVVTF